MIADSESQTGHENVYSTAQDLAFEAVGCDENQKDNPVVMNGKMVLAGRPKPNGWWERLFSRLEDGVGASFSTTASSGD
jgi:hypothetical protein